MYLGQQGFDRNSQSIFIKKFLIKLAFPIRNSDAIFAFSSLVGSKSNEEAKRLTWQQPQSSLVTLGQNSMIRQKFQFLFQIIQKWIKSSEEKIVKIQPTSNQFSKKDYDPKPTFCPSVSSPSFSDYWWERRGRRRWQRGAKAAQQPAY